MVAEMAAERGDLTQVASSSEVVPPGSADLSPVIELFPKVDPMQITRDEWLELPDLQKHDVILSLRRKSYDPMWAAQSARIFPEGYASPLTEIEHRVFDAMGRAMNNGIEVSPRDRQTLAEHLHDISVDDAITELREEGRNRAAGNFWFSRYDIGGYELNRLIANEIEILVRTEQQRDLIRMHALQDMAIRLRKAGIPMLEPDLAELERLKAEHDERERAIEAYWIAEREKGYKNIRVH